MRIFLENDPPGQWWERVVYQQGHTAQLTMAMEDIMATLGWVVILPDVSSPRATSQATPHA